MYGGSGKLGRGGGGGGAGKRNLHSSFHPPPLRPSGPTGATGGRLSVGGGPRNRNTSSGGPSTSSAPSTAAEETFSLVTGNPLNFAMIIRLAPDLVEEIKRVEAHGGTARIKFDSNANNTSGNVIDVGGKDFRFTWSREMGDLCDIYEERQSGEDGNGLLVESGCAWRKLNVQRVLDESTKNHVKMRSEEAERKLKSRKAIVLDHQNPSMKSQMKALAAVEVNPWKNFKQKKEPPLKKRKVEPPPVAIGGPPRPAYKPGLSSTIAKGRHSVSPLPSPPEPAGAPASPFGTEYITRGPTSVEGVVPIQATNKENFIGFEKVVPGRATGGTGSGKSSVKRNLGAKPTDLRSMLISLLTEQPKGMSLKALEKAVGDTIPNSVKKIEPIIKQIATFQAPGRYILKPGVELENFKKPSSESGSSPEDNHLKTPVPEDNHGQIPIPELDLPEKTFPNELNSELRGESNVLEKIDIEHRSPDRFGDKKFSDNTEGPAVSSSESGSDSDSDSDSSDSGSDSGSHSKSRSKSRSPVGSGTGSSSDSETDASSNSKEGSDEDVDIMTSDDEKESKHKLQVSEPGFSTSPIPYGGPAQNSIIKNQGIGSNVVDIEKDFPDGDEETEIDILTNSMPNNQVENCVEETKPFSPEHQERQVYTANLHSERENVFGERETVANEGFKHGKISKGKSKRASDVRHLDEKSERAKRSKAGNLARSQISLGRNSFFSESPHQLSPDGLIDDLQKGPSSQTKIKVVSEGNADPSLQKGYKQGIPRKSVLDSQESGRRSIDPSERSVKNAESLGRGVKYPEKNLHGDEGFSIQKDKVHRETQKVPNLHMADNNRAIDRPPVINGRGIVLQRELSDLELGELREPFPDEVPGTKKQFERKSSFKQSENKQSSSDYWNSDLGKGKPPGKAAADPRKLSSPHLRGGVPSNQDGPIKKRTPEHHGEDLARPHHRGQSQPQNPSRLDNSEVGPHSNKLADVTGKTRHNGLVPDSAKESKTQKSTLVTLTDTRKDISLTESNDGVVKRRDFSSDENSCSYSKYEKEEPELKGPIKDFSQYKEYVQEYSEKYDSYSSLNKILETYRNEFQKLGKDLENAKGRDVERYHNILGQLNESYQQCGARHKRLKKIFVVLHEELKQLKQMIKDFADSCARD